jgi:hypothetical protein
MVPSVQVRTGLLRIVDGREVLQHPDICFKSIQLENKHQGSEAFTYPSQGCPSGSGTTISSHNNTIP